MQAFQRKNLFDAIRSPRPVTRAAVEAQARALSRQLKIETQQATDLVLANTALQQVGARELLLGSDAARTLERLEGKLGAGFEVLLAELLREDRRFVTWLEPRDQ